MTLTSEFNDVDAARKILHPAPSGSKHGPVVKKEKTGRNEKKAQGKSPEKTYGSVTRFPQFIKQRKFIKLSRADQYQAGVK